MMKNLKQIRKEVDLIRDKLGKPIEKGIKELVIGLHYCGIETGSSCEGHTNRGLPYPWVTVGYKFAEKIATVISWQNRPILPSGEKNINTWVIQPGVDLNIIPEDKTLPLKELQAGALDFGLFLQKRSPNWFPEGWFEK